MNLPVLYSFRRCPYAIRARLGLYYAQCAVEHREVLLRNKPEAMLRISPKGTVPVLQLGNGVVMDESLEIITWALRSNDPECLLPDKKPISERADALISENDNQFKYWLDHYKYADRHSQHTAEYYRQKGEGFLQQLEDLLQQNLYLLGGRISIADIAIVPFVRQFAHVDKNWFFNAAYPGLQQWLNHWLASESFMAAMAKHQQWQPD